MSELKNLVQKLSSDIPEIRIRSITNLHMKISHHLVSHEVLAQFQELPGLLMYWINDNKKKSDTLLKVIQILLEFAKFDRGKLLLREYECLQFCEQFKIYLVQNERGINMFLQPLEEIIRLLSPLGRAEESKKVNDRKNKQQHRQLINQSKDETVNKKNSKAISDSLKMVNQVFPLNQQQQKEIFQLLMKLKYAKKQTIYFTLSEIRSFVIHYWLNSFRCKLDLFSTLYDLVSQNLFPELSIEIISILLRGIFQSYRRTKIKSMNEMVSFVYGKVNKIQTFQLDLSLPLLLFNSPSSFILLQILIESFQLGQNVIPLNYLLNLKYKYSCEYYLRVLELANHDELIQNLDICIPIIEGYCKSFPQKAKQFIVVLPEKVWKKTKILQQFSVQQQRNDSYECLQNYLESSFSITNNLHIMREIIQNLKKGIKGIIKNIKPSIKLYLDVLLTLTISVSKQDPIMSYYSQAQQLVSDIIQSSNNEIVITVYESILEVLNDTKHAINYPGFTIPKNEVIEILFTSPQFTKTVFQISLEITQCLSLMLDIVILFLQKDKFKLFGAYVPLIFALCSHPSQKISSRANNIIQRMPKNYASICIALKLFSANSQSRRNLLKSLSNTKNQIEIDIVEKVHEGSFAHKKKQLKISQAAIDNYMNIVLNPSLQQSIRESGMNQFIDCLEKAGNAQLKSLDLEDAIACLVQQLKKYGKKQKLNPLQEKFVHLYYIVWEKLCFLQEHFSIQFLLGLICKITSMICRAALLSLIFLRTFQTPFKNPIGQRSKNFAIMYYPHIQMIKMNIEHPIRCQSKQQLKQTKNNPQMHIQVKNSTKFDLAYFTMLDHINSKGDIISEEKLQRIEQQLVNAITSTDLPKINKLSFALFCSKNVTLSKTTSKIIIQYIRTNTVALDISFDLSRILAVTQFKGGDVIDLQINNVAAFANWLSYGLVGMKGKTVGNQYIEKLLKCIDIPQNRGRVLNFLIKQNAVKLGSMNQYNALKLTQALILVIRSCLCFEPNRLLSYCIFQKLLTNEQFLVQNSSTLQNLIHTNLYQKKVTSQQFCLALYCYGQIINEQLKRTSKLSNKMAINVVQQVCSLVNNIIPNDSSSQELNYIVIGGSFAFLSNILRLQLAQSFRQINQVIENHPSNLLLLACRILPKSFPLQETDIFKMVPHIFSFLFYQTMHNSDNISTLLNSTDILQTLFHFIETLSSSCEIAISKKIENLQSIGRLLHILASKADQFLFKTNKILRNENVNAEYKLHYILMSAMPIYLQFQVSKPQKLINQNMNYFAKMVIWIFYIFKQQSKILQEEDFIRPLVQYVLNLKKIQMLSPLLIKSSCIQKIAGEETDLGHKFKNWSKSVQQIIYDKQSKINKKIEKIEKKDLNRVEQNKVKVKDGLIFASTLYHVIETNDSYSQSHIFKDNLALCVKFLDQVTVMLEMEKDQNISTLHTRVMINISQNYLSMKHLGSIIAESQFQTIIKLVKKAGSITENILQLSSQLSLLGKLCFNQAIRSMVIKNRIIQHLQNVLIGMDENKVSKINYGNVYCIVEFFLWLSTFKDTNAKIQNEKKIIDIWIKIIGLQQSEAVQQKVLELLINLSAFKHSKTAFMNSRQIHKTCLGLLEDPDYGLKHLILNLIYNFLYKNAAGIRLYKKKEVIEVIQNLTEVEELKEISGIIIDILENSQ